jgi:MFS family permease
VGATAALADRPGHLVRFHALFNIGGAFGAVVAAALLGLTGAVGWRLAWAAAAVFVVVALVLSLGADLPAGHPGEKVRLSEGMRTLHRERLIPVALAFALGATVEGGVNTWGVLQLRGQLDAGLVVGAGGAVLGYLIAAVARLSVSRVQTAAGARRVVAAGTVVAGCGLVVLATVTVPVAAAAGLVMAAGGISVCWPLLMSEVGRGRERPGMVVGAVSTVGYLGAIVGPGAIGLVAGAFGLSTGLLVLAVGAFGIPLLLRTGRR